MKFSILGLLGIVAFVALGLGALFNANDVWTKLIFTASVLLLFTSVVGAVYSHGAARAFWLGFAVFGIGYFLLYWDAVAGRAQELITHDAVMLAYNYIPKPSDVTDPKLHPTVQGQRSTLHYFNFRRIGHALWTVMFGFAGGVIARWFHRRRQKQQPVAP